MTRAFDEQMMAIALELAARGRPSPNPHVGCVIVRDGEIIARGYHHRAGLAHAEIDALRKLDHRADGATAYITLEPCNHHGRTPPCSEALIRAGVKRVVIGCEDRIPGHDGGAERLRDAGIEVTMGVRREQAERMVRDFYKRALEGMPFVTLKAAVTLDGRMATRTGDSRWITGEEARKHAHRLRDRSEAILVGVGTVIADDPQLTVRHVTGEDPIRVVLDSSLRTPPSAAMLHSGSRAPTWIFHGPDANVDRAQALRDAGAELFEVQGAEYGVDLRAVLRTLAQRDITRLLVEGGPRVHGEFLDQGLADAAAVFVAPKILGDGDAQPLAHGAAKLHMRDALRLQNPKIVVLGDDVLFEGLIGPSE